MNPYKQSYKVYSFVSFLFLLLSVYIKYSKACIFQYIQHINVSLFSNDQTYKKKLTPIKKTNQSMKKLLPIFVSFIFKITGGKYTQILVDF